MTATTPIRIREAAGLAVAVASISLAAAAGFAPIPTQSIARSVPGCALGGRPPVHRCYRPRARKRRPLAPANAVIARALAAHDFESFRKRA
jgi:hypothetical protein